MRFPIECPQRVKGLFFEMKTSVFLILPLSALFSSSTLLAQDLLGKDSLPNLADFASGDNCTFKADSNAFLQQKARAISALHQRVASFDKARADTAGAKPDTVSASSIPHNNLIDDEIFGKLASMNVPSAQLSGDEEFLRRVTVDLTGRIPAAADVRAFVADPNPGKRNAIIDSLLYSPEFSDKWTMWLGDLVENNATALNVNRNIQARNAFYKFLWINVSDDSVSLHDLVYNIVNSNGNTYDEPGAPSFILGGIAPGGPIDDEYDMLAYKTAKMFLGLGNYDCLMCHNGRGHLDAINLWGSTLQRSDAEQMSAFLSHERHPNYVVSPSAAPDVTAFYNGSSIVSEASSANSSYSLPTTFGNRPNRSLINGKTTASPIYRTGQKPGSSNWRSDYATFLVNDPMFPINFANRLWKAMFNYGLVDNADTLDPARLDPSNPPDAPWTLQATHPLLLTRLANEFVAHNYGLRAYLRLITQSSAYQLSSRYSGDWTELQVPLFARHYVRRLTGEEVHDAINKATAISPKYTVQGWALPVSWAMQLPDTSEPRSNGASANFMNNFLRGNRDNVPRLGLATIGQSQSLMNDTFVTTRIKMAASPELQAVAKLTTVNAQIDEMYYTFLGRLPSDYERSHATAYLAKATTTAAKNTALEDLAWALINKLEFVFSY